MGKRYTEEEKRLIRELADQGHIDETIAQRLHRSTNAIRNHRHRNNIKTRETQTIHELRQIKQTLQHKTLQIKHEIWQLEQRRTQLQQDLQLEETLFIKKLESQLSGLKDRKPELFTITAQDQINKLTAQLSISFIKWLIE